MTTVNITTITRDSLAGKRRSDVSVGQVFSYLSKKGVIRDEKFLSLGSSDRMYSVKASNGELSGTDLSKGSKPVAIVGTWTARITLFKDPANFARVHRRHLTVGQGYRANADGETYIHLGVLSNGKYLAFNSKTSDYATTEVGDKEVILCGTSCMDVRILK